MNKPFVSVIIPTFNRPALVQQAVESVLNQQGAYQFDVLVIDDGSTSDTAQALSRFGTAIRHVRQENRGLNPARNHGLRLARGDLVALLDDDDVWLPSKTSMLLAALNQFPRAGFVHSNFRIWKPDRDEFRDDGLRSWFPRPFRWDEIYSEYNKAADAYCGDLYYWSLFAPMVLPSTAIIRRAALGTDTWFPERDSVGDWEFFARLSHRTGAVFVPRETTLNRSHDDAVRLTRTDPRLRVQRRIGLLRQLWRQDAGFMSAHARDVNEVEAGCLRRLAKLSIASGNSADARRCLQELRAIPGRVTLADRVSWALSWMPFADGCVQLLRTVRGRLRNPAPRGF